MQRAVAARYGYLFFPLGRRLPQKLIAIKETNTCKSTFGPSTPGRGSATALPRARPCRSCVHSSCCPASGNSPRLGTCLCSTYRQVDLPPELSYEGAIGIVVYLVGCSVPALRFDVCASSRSQPRTLSSSRNFPSCKTICGSCLADPQAGLLQVNVLYFITARAFYLLERCSQLAVLKTRTSPRTRSPELG